MLKFFRKYVMNKWTLAVGGAILMIMFLLPTQAFQGGPDDRPLGEVDGADISSADMRHAGDQLLILSSLSPLFTNRLVEEDGDWRVAAIDALQWLLMLHEAQQMGLSASDHEVTQFLESFGFDDDAIRSRAARFGTSVGTLREAIRSRIIVHRYMALVQGLADVPIEEWAQIHNGALQRLMQQDPRFGPVDERMAFAVHDMAQGKPRINRELLEHFLHDTWATVDIGGVAVNATHYLDRVGQPEAKTVAELFHKHRDRFRGEGEPFGLGYKFPDRVRLEYLSLSDEQVRQAVKIEEAQAMRYYQENPQEFTAAPSPGQSDAATVARPYREVREQVISQLRRRKALELAEQILKESLAMMLDDARRLETREGYRAVPADWQPIALTEVAQRIQEQFDILPEVRRIDDRWLEQSDLEGLAGIGDSVLPTSRGGIPFDLYVTSTRELAEPDHPLAPLRLQQKLPSQPLVAPDGRRHYIFRIIEAQKAHVPESIDEVLEQVLYDARRIEAYKLLVEEQDQWLSRLRAQGAAALAEETGAVRLDPPPFPKRRPGGAEGLVPPDVPEVGQSARFVDAVFDLAEQLTQAGSIAEASEESRTTAIALDSRLTLYLVRIEGYAPMSRTDFEVYATLPDLPKMIVDTLERQVGAATDPLSLEAIRARVGYRDFGVAEDADEGEGNADVKGGSADEQDAPAS